MALLIIALISSSLTPPPPKVSSISDIEPPSQYSMTIHISLPLRKQSKKETMNGVRQVERI
jgi:hypothetical protein